MAADMDFVPVTLPLFHIEALPWHVPDPAAYDALLITSANAIHLGGDGLAALTSLPVYAVGGKSAQRAAQAGFTIAATGDTDSAQIAAMAAANGAARLLWLCGKNRTVVDPPAGVHLDSRIIYDAARLPPPPDFAQQVQDAGAVMLHSPRAARYFAQICAELALDKSAVTIAALSANIAKNAGSGWAKIIIAARPCDRLLLAKIASDFTSSTSGP
ncbi:uroporphyrinogen-III synthase [Sphingorhabdus arenilitoris]|uniref:Uroporphyrinogen-III synthase n=1 Tax=Sphingorhabdus arenilitoris TaxID=1490041 RepID=A0ABV8RLY9_9SPHN